MSDIDKALADLELFLLNCLAEVAAKRAELQSIPFPERPPRTDPPADINEVFDRR